VLNLPRLKIRHLSEGEAAGRRESSEPFYFFLSLVSPSPCLILRRGKFSTRTRRDCDWLAAGRVHSFEPWLLTVAALSAISLVRCRMYSSLRPLARLSTSTAQQLESTSISNSTTPRRRATHTTRHARTNKWTTRIRNLYRSTTTAAAAGKPRWKGQGWQRPVAGAGGGAARVGAGVARGGRHPCRGFFGFPPPCPFRQRHGRRLDLGHAPQCCTFKGKKKNEVSNQ